MLDQTILVQLASNDSSLVKVELKALTQAELLSLLNTITNNTVVESIDLTDCYFNEVGDLLSKLFAKFSSLKTLCLKFSSAYVYNHNSIGVRCICYALQDNKSLQALSFCQQFFSREATAFLKAYLSKSQTLRSLKFEKCVFESTTFLENVLMKNIFLEHLHLYSSGFDYDAIFSALEKNKSLHTLYLQGQPINWEKLLSVLKVNRALKRINLKGENSIQLGTLVKLYEIVTENYMLKDLNIDPLIISPLKPRLFEGNPFNFEYNSRFCANYAEEGNKVFRKIQAQLVINTNMQKILNPLFKQLNNELLDIEQLSLTLASVSELMLDQHFSKDHFYSESWRLIRGLFHFVYGNWDMALHALLPPFTDPNLASVANHYCRNALFLADNFKERNSAIQNARYQWMAYCSTKDNTDKMFLTALAGVYLKKPPLVEQLEPTKIMKNWVKADCLLTYEDIVCIAQIALTTFTAKKQSEERSILNIDRSCDNIRQFYQNWQQDSYRLSLEKEHHQGSGLLEQLIHPLQEALSSVIADDWHDQKRCLESFLRSPCCSPDALSILLKSKAFVQQLKLHYPNKETFRLLENYLLTPTVAVPNQDIFSIPNNQACGPMSAHHVEAYIAIASKKNADHEFYDPLRDARHMLMITLVFPPRIKTQSEHLDLMINRINELNTPNDFGHLNIVVSDLQSAYDTQLYYPNYYRDGGYFTAGKKWDDWGGAILIEKCLLEQWGKQLMLYSPEQSIMRSLKILAEYIEFIPLKEMTQLAKKVCVDSWLGLKLMCLMVEMKCDAMSEIPETEAISCIDKNLLKIRLKFVHDTVYFLATKRFHNAYSYFSRAPSPPDDDLFAGHDKFIKTCRNPIDERELILGLKKLIENLTLLPLEEALAYFQNDVPHLFTHEKYSLTLRKLFGQLKYEEQRFYETIQKDDFQTNYSHRI